MLGKRSFFTGPRRIIGDPRPSALDLRVLACVSMHDGMSLMPKKPGQPPRGGRGCYATFATLTAEIGCDASNLSKALKRLVEWGYLSEERQHDRRRKTYRVIFEVENVGETTNHFVGSDANDLPEIVGNDESGNGGNPPQTEQHYSSLKGLDTLEREKLDSSEEARFAARRLPKMKFDDNLGAQLAAFERAWSASPESFTDQQLIEWNDRLREISDDYDPDDPNVQRATRLYYALDMSLWERGIITDESGELAA